MLSSDDIIKIWGRENLQRAPVEHASILPISASDRRFLVEIGLPNVEHLLLTFDLSKPFLTLAETVASRDTPKEWKRLWIIGSEDGQPSICLDENHDGAVLSFDSSRKETRYINSGVPSGDVHRFTLQRYQDLWAELKNIREGTPSKTVAAVQELFEMLIADVFYMSGGRITFGGTVSGTENFIGPCQCEVVVDGKQFAIIKLEGEMMPTSMHKNLRSVSTLDPLKLDKDLVAKGVCKLRSL